MQSTDLFDDDIVDIPTLPGWIRDLADRAEKPVTRAGDVPIQWHAWGEGRPVVLLHGGHGSWMHWVRNVEALAARGFRVLAADLPGAGLSGDFQTDDLEEMAQLVAAGIGELAPDQPVRMAGFSFGSVLGSITLKHLPAGVESFAMLGSPLLGGRSSVNSRLAKWRGMPIPEHRAAAHAQNVGMLMLTGPDSVTDEATAIQMTHAEQNRGRHRGLFDKLDVPGDLRRWGGRLTVIYGERDAIAEHHLEERRTIVAGILPDAEFHVIPGIGHWVQYQAPDAVNDILAARLD
ncbi:MAG: alpha/beta fold hydrolase [Pseudooceanicola sp.]